MADGITTDIQDLWSLMGVLTPMQRGLAQSMNRFWTNGLPPGPEIVHAFRTSNLAPTMARKAIEALGAYGPREIYDAQFQLDQQRDRAIPRMDREEMGGWPSVWQAVWKAGEQPPSSAECLSLYTRQYLDGNDLADLLTRNGFYNDNDRDKLIWLSQNRIPGPDQLVSFAVKDVWDQAVVDRFAYDAEFPPEFGFWMRSQGFAGNAEPLPPAQQNPGGIDWPKLFWRQHWRNLSPTQAYEMFQRLRPGRTDRYAGFIPDIRPFTYDDLARSLKVNDFPAPFRSQLAAIAYKLPRLVDIDRFYRIGTIDEREVYEMHLDRGYSPEDARLRTRWLVNQRMTRPANPILRDLPKQIVEMYTLGRLTKAQAGDRILAALSNGAFTNFDTAPDDPELRVAYLPAREMAAAMLDAADLKMELDNTKKLIRALRKQFLTGQINETTLRQELVAMRFEANWSTNFIAQMRAELASGRLLLSTERIGKLVATSMISLAYADQYLSNLGWKNPERQILLGQFRKQMDAEQAKADARQASDTRRAEAAQMREANILRRARADVVTRLNRQASPAKLKRYFVRGIITLEELARELERRGFDAGYRTRFLEDAQLERTTYRGARRSAPLDTAGDVGGGGQFLGAPPQEEAPPGRPQRNP